MIPNPVQCEDKALKIKRTLRIQGHKAIRDNSILPYTGFGARGRSLGVFDANSVFMLAGIATHPNTEIFRKNNILGPSVVCAHLVNEQGRAVVFLTLVYKRFACALLWGAVTRVDFIKISPRFQIIRGPALAQIIANKTLKKFGNSFGEHLFFKKKSIAPFAESSFVCVRKRKGL